MIDIKFVCENTDWVKNSLAKKGFNPEKVDELVQAYLDLNKLKTSSQAKLEEKNKLSNAIKSSSADERPAIIAKSKAIGEELKAEQVLLDEAQAKFDDMLLRMPNYPCDECPVGPDDSANVVVRKVGTPREFTFKPRDQVELCELNEWTDMERIAKVSGAELML